MVSNTFSLSKFKANATNAEGAGLVGEGLKATNFTGVRLSKVPALLRGSF